MALRENNKFSKTLPGDMGGWDVFATVCVICIMCMLLLNSWMSDVT